MSLRANIFYQVKTPGDCGAATRYFAEHLVKNDTASRAFQFGNLELTDDERVLEVKTADFGKIEVKLRTVEAYAPLEKPSTARTLDEDYRVHERAKKGMAHCVKLGEEKPMTTISRVLRAVNSKKVHTFVFNYRHMDMLIANDIAPRLASSAPKPSALVVTQSSRTPSSSSSRPNATPGPSQISPAKRKAEVMIKEEDGDDGRSDTADTEIEAQLVALKAKKASKRVKKEDGTSTLVHGEVIDLTAVDLDDGDSRVAGKVKKESQGQGSLVSGMVIDLT